MSVIAELIRGLQAMTQDDPPKPKACYYLASDGTIQCSNGDAFQPLMKPSMIRRGGAIFAIASVDPSGG